MQDLNISIVQADQFWEDKNKNYDNYAQLLKDVSCDLILLPEMFNTGFSMNVSELAEEWKSGYAFSWLKDMAIQKEAAIYTSLIVKENDETFNRGVFVHPSGRINYYDKRKSFGLAKEDLHYSSGNKETVVNYLGWKIQLQICYDLRFPELVRNRIESDGKPAYDVILYVANWPDKRSVHWNSLLKARAIENQCYVAAANRVGIDHNNLSYSGYSQILDPLGENVAVLRNKEGVISDQIKKETIQLIRNTLPFLKDA